MVSRKEEAALRERAARKRQRLQLLLWALDDWMFKEDAMGMRILSIRVQTRGNSGGEKLVVVKAQHEGRAYVGFHSSETAEDAILGALDRVRNADLKWREDTPYEERANQ